MMRGMKAETWLLVPLAILLAVSISLCFAYKAKLNSANRYIEVLKKSQHRSFTNSISHRDWLNATNATGGIIHIR